MKLGESVWVREGMLLIESCLHNGHDDHVNWREVALRRAAGMNFGCEYYSVHVSTPECKCLELICIIGSHINLTALESYCPCVRNYPK